MTCTFDFYPDWNKEKSKFIFVTWATVFCCVAPLLAITILSYYIIKKVRRSRKVKNGKNVVEKKVREMHDCTRLFRHKKLKSMC